MSEAKYDGGPAFPIPGRKLYKVLLDGKSFHGGDLKWSLPKGKRPGKWHEVDGALNMCSRGLHLTWEPVRWWRLGCSIFEAEGDGIEGETDDACKVVCRRARLLREVVDAAELARLGVFVAGRHEIREGVGYAYGSAQVTASGSAQVTAYDSAQVRAYDSAQVTAYDSARVEARHNVTIVLFRGSADVVLGDNAVLIDRRNGRPVVTVAESTK